MKVMYTGESDPLELINGKVYSSIGEEAVAGQEYYRVVDETGEDYLYEKDLFKIV